ncbi:uncharacterized protein A4U43_C10F16690 [Asparagus officinalis]|uniref:O-methyltransferase domain-containing protein n=1 Tax=Asparagus officinalis TaxID=4686 RepID=A0A5P1E6J3_ASPOF|nr:trans-resveratrol di-O-methyltransferase-like [Asparagus officinalis]ONK57107.1 uncharacterized protein A4U43_C10F16690 [Asparagus officinalis]
MGSLRVGSPQELLRAQSHIWNHTFSFINSMSLKCAVELNIPDIIHNHGNSITLSDLSNSLSIPRSKAPCLRRLMSLLVHSKFLSEERIGVNNEESVFSLTVVSQVFLTENKSNASPFLLLMLDQILLRPWHFLSEWFKGDEPTTAFEIAHGVPVWDAMRKMVGFSDMFIEGMSSDASFTTEIIVRDCGEVFRGLRSLVDVGGGTGTLARAVAREFGLKCAVLELPYVVEGSEESEEVKFVGGDMFDYVPTADAVLLKWVLHDWSDEECVQILKNCKEAIPLKEEGGKVIIMEMVMDSSIVGHELAQTQFLFDLHMMAHTTGKERSEQMWQKIFMDAGFRGYKILPILGLRSVIEVYR